MTEDLPRCERCSKWINFDVRRAGRTTCPWCGRANETCRCAAEDFCRCVRPRCQPEGTNT